MTQLMCGCEWARGAPLLPPPAFRCGVRSCSCSYPTVGPEVLVVQYRVAEPINSSTTREREEGRRSAHTPTGRAFRVGINTHMGMAVGLRPRRPCWPAGCCSALSLFLSLSLGGQARTTGHELGFLMMVVLVARCRSRRWKRRSGRRTTCWRRARRRTPWSGSSSPPPPPPSSGAAPAPAPTTTTRRPPPPTRRAGATSPSAGSSRYVNTQHVYYSYTSEPATCCCSCTWPADDALANSSSIPWIGRFQCRPCVGKNFRQPTIRPLIKQKLPTSIDIYRNQSPKDEVLAWPTYTIGSAAQHGMVKPSPDWGVVGTGRKEMGDVLLIQLAGRYLSPSMIHW